MIRNFRPDDLEALRAITAICFDGVSIDQNIERRYGIIRGKGWQWRKAGHIDLDVAAHAGGIFVWEAEGAVIGFVSARPNRETGIGWIPNLSVLPGHQGRGIGKALIGAALDYLREQGMSFVRIETIEQNEAAVALYPRLGFVEVARQIHYVMPLDGGPGPA
jgi:ribosomal protein S18 acetylase RimI-like enzyme